MPKPNLEPWFKVKTELSRQLGALAEAAGLKLARREAVGLNGAFIVARLDKPDRQRRRAAAEPREHGPRM